jgi:AcrR family transcriptional regulator
VETRARIAEAALKLFVTQGYAETTIDQIAVEAGVGRRTVFRHFATKDAMLFDHLVARRDFAIRRLQQRPASEPPLVSLHAVLRELCRRGYDRAFLEQIRTVLALEPRFAVPQLSIGLQVFEETVVATLERRHGTQYSYQELQALTEMAETWFLTAIRIYFRQGRASLIKCFDEVVARCVQSSVRDLAPSLTPAPR